MLFLYSYVSILFFLYTAQNNNVKIRIKNNTEDEQEYLASSSLLNHLISFTFHSYFLLASYTHSTIKSHPIFYYKNYLTLTPIFLMFTQALCEFFILFITSCFVNKILCLLKILIIGFEASALINPLFWLSWHFWYSIKYKKLVNAIAWVYLNSFSYWFF